MVRRLSLRRSLGGFEVSSVMARRLLAFVDKPHADDIVPLPAQLALADRAAGYMQLEFFGHGLAGWKLEPRAAGRQVAHAAHQDALAAVEYRGSAFQDGAPILTTAT